MSLSFPLIVASPNPLSRSPRASSPPSFAAKLSLPLCLTFGLECIRISLSFALIVSFAIECDSDSTSP
jgi:hypothetical protein